MKFDENYGKEIKPDHIVPSIQNDEPQEANFEENPWKDVIFDKDTPEYNVLREICIRFKYVFATAARKSVYDLKYHKDTIL